MKKELAEAFQALPRAEHISFGWGDKVFYLETPTWGDMQLGTALRAMFFRSETAMHLTYHYGVSKAWYEISLCPVRRENLIACLLESFERDEQGQLIEIPNAGYTPHDRFYEATVNYSFLCTCNNWSNQALKKAQVKTARWSPFDYGCCVATPQGPALMRNRIPPAATGAASDGRC